MDKNYIGKVEAWEYCIERNIEKLPRKGIEIITAYSKCNGKLDSFIGKDEQGYYIGEIENENKD